MHRTILLSMSSNDNEDVAADQDEDDCRCYSKKKEKERKGNQKNFIRPSSISELCYVSTAENKELDKRVNILNWPISKIFAQVYI